MDGRMRPAGKPRAPPSPFLWCPAVGQLALPAPKPLCGMLRDPAFLQASLHLTPRPPPADPESPPGQWAPLLPQETPKEEPRELTLEHQRGSGTTDGPRGWLSRHLWPRLAESPRTRVAAPPTLPATLAPPSGALSCSQTLGPYRCLLCTLAKCHARVPGAGGGQDSCTRRREAGVDKARGPWTIGAA